MVDLKTRIRNKYFVNHLIASILALAGFAVIIRYYWYPDVLFSVAGGIDGLKILLGVDIILGPVLTLLFFTKKLSPPKTDFVLILIIQVACLTAGLTLIYKQKPLALVYIGDTAYTINEGTFIAHNKPIPNFDSEDKPPSFYIELPEDPATRKELFRSQLKNGLLQSRTEQFIAIEDNKEIPSTLGFTIKGLKSFAESNAITLDTNRLAEHSSNPNIRAFILKTGHRRTFLLLDGKTAKRLSVLTH